MRIRNITRAVSRAAFTLTEMLIVVAIIVMLAGISVTILLPQLEKAKEDTARSKATAVKGAAELWMKDHDSDAPPPNAQTLAQPDEVLSGAAYITDEGAKDPWGQYYQFKMGPSGQVVAFTQHRGKMLENK
jgi:prepilin-type N-terminal cleavage/methylation domain-containing protein